jgi:hypothetical protein
LPRPVRAGALLPNFEKRSWRSIKQRDPAHSQIGVHRNPQLFARIVLRDGDHPMLSVRPWHAGCARLTLPAIKGERRHPPQIVARMLAELPDLKGPRLQQLRLKGSNVIKLPLALTALMRLLVARFLVGFFGGSNGSGSRARFTIWPTQAANWNALHLAATQLRE